MDKINKQQITKFSQRLAQTIQEMQDFYNDLQKLLGEESDQPKTWVSDSHTTTEQTSTTDMVSSPSWLIAVLAPLYKIKLVPLSNIHVNFTEVYLADLQKEIPRPKSYYSKSKEGKLTNYQLFISEGGLSFTQPNTPEREAQLKGWEQYFDFVFPQSDTKPFYIKKKPGVHLPDIELEYSVKNRAKRPVSFSSVQPVTYEEVCAKAGHIPSKGELRDIDINSLMDYYGLHRTASGEFVRNLSFAKGDY